MSISLSGLDAFAELTLNKFEKNRWVFIGQDLQRYTFVDRHFKNGKAAEEGGEKLEWKIQYDFSDNTRDTQPYDTDEFHVADYVTNATVPWSWQTNNITWDVYENAFQSGPTKIVSVLQQRWHSMWMDYFTGMERRLWSKPASSSTSPVPPYGIPYWIVKNATEGFNGGNPSGFTAGPGGVDTTDARFANWKNWTGTYSAVSRTDLVRKLTTALEKTHFVSPHSFANLDNSGKPDFMLYTVFSVWQTMKEMQEARNDNLGPDVGYYKGTLVVNGHPVMWVPIISADGELADSQNPVYGINHQNFKYFYKTGFAQKLSGVVTNANKHTVRHQHLDNAGNFRMINRRTGGFVIYYVAA